MKIKIIKTKGKIEHLYVAADGLEFKNKANCIDHERNWMWTPEKEAELQKRRAERIAEARAKGIKFVR